MEDDYDENGEKKLLGLKNFNEQSKRFMNREVERKRWGLVN